MTWQNPPPFKPDSPKKGKKITPEQLAASGSEHGSQAALFAWAADNVGKYPQLKYMFAIPNGGLRDVRVAANLKAEGVKAGVPDIMLPWASWIWSFTSDGVYNVTGWHGLFIEMKVGKNKPTKEQEEYIDYLKSAGYYCVVCYAWNVARDAIIAYLEGKL